jgi:hypothetical protein
MQDATTRSELHSLQRSGDLPPINGEPTQPLANKPAEHDEPTGTLKGEPPVGGTQSPLRLSGSLSRISLTFGDCWVYNFKWSLFSCSKKCFSSYYGRVFPKCEDDPEYMTISPKMLTEFPCQGTKIC